VLRAAAEVELMLVASHFSIQLLYAIGCACDPLRFGIVAILIVQRPKACPVPALSELEKH